MTWRELPIRTGFAALLLSLMFTEAAFAQRSSKATKAKPHGAKASQSLPTVAQILDRYVQAIGGEAALRKVTSRAQKFTFIETNSGVNGSVELYTQAPNLRLQIIKLKTKDGTALPETMYGFDGAVSWKAFAFLSRVHSGAEFASDKRDADFYRDLRLRELYPTLSFKGTARVGLRSAFVIEAKPAADSAASSAKSPAEKWYFDTETGLLIKIVAPTFEDQKLKGTVVTWFEDYQPVDGIKLPYTLRVVHSSPSASNSILKTQEIKHDLALDAARFKRPDVALKSLAPASPESATVLADIERAVEEKRRSLNVPGAALAIVYDDQVVLLKGFGVRDVKSQLPVTPDTLFGIGSITKSFTGMAAVISAEEGKLSLDDSPKKYLPYFKLSDPEADAGVTLRDLLSHRTGLPAWGNDDAWDGAKNTPEEIIKIAMSAKPTAKFRAKGQYSNVMYIAAGEVIGAAHHSTWEEIVVSRIFQPLGMRVTNVSSHAMKQREDFAEGHTEDGNLKGTAERDNTVAAGTINSNAREMTQWLRLLLNGGTVDGKRLVSERGFQELLTKFSEVNGNAYGLGIFQYDWLKSLGFRVYGHAGGADGFSSWFCFVPELKLGLAILTNAEADNGLSDATMGIVLQKLLLR